MNSAYRLWMDLLWKIWVIRWTVNDKFVKWLRKELGIEHDRAMLLTMFEIEQGESRRTGEEVMKMFREVAEELGKTNGDLKAARMSIQEATRRLNFYTKESATLAAIDLRYIAMVKEEQRKEQEAAMAKIKEQQEKCAAKGHGQLQAVDKKEGYLRCTKCGKVDKAENMGPVSDANA